MKRKWIKTVMITALITCFSPAVMAKKKSKSSDIKQPKAEQLRAFMTDNAAKQASRQDIEKADDLRLQTIQSINTLLNSKMKEERKFELYLRLGELYTERHDYIREIEIRDFEQKFNAWSKREGKAKGKEPQLDYKKSKAQLHQSVAAFRKIVKDFPKHPRADAAMFALAKTLLQLESDNAVFYFEKIIKDYKNSVLLPETYLALGEYYFYQHNMAKALDYYKQAIRFKDSKIYTFAVYKLGWAYFNVASNADTDQTKSVDKAITAFKLVVKLSDAPQNRGRSFNLKNEAINDLIVVFADYRRTDEALAYFKSIGENDAFYDMLDRMGNQYVEIGESKKAIAIFNRLLTEAPNRARNFEVYTTLASLYHNDSNSVELVKTMKKMNSIFVKKSTWQEENSADEELLAKAAEKTQKQIHRYGTLYHKQGMKAEKKVFLSSAIDLYDLYLTSFPKAKESYELRFYFAELHFYFKSYDKAADQYLIVSRAEGKYREDSARRAVIAMKNIDDKQKYSKLPPLGQVAKALPVPGVKQKLIKVIDNFVELLPKEKDGNAMRYTAAYTLFEYGHYPNALKRFGDIVNQIPKTKQGQSSVQMIIGYYQERKEWDELIAVCRQFLSNENIGKSKLQKKLSDTLRESLFGQAVRLSKNKKYLESAKAFVAYQKEFQTAKDADDALYNATYNYYKNGSVEDAVAKGKLLLKTYPQSRHVPKAILDIAQTNESLAEFKEAAVFYEMFHTKFAKDKRSRSALFNAATLYKGMKLYSEAIGAYTTFLKRYPRNKLAKQIRLDLADTYEKDKQYRAAINTYDKYAKTLSKGSEERYLARAKAATIEGQHGKKRQADREFSALYKQLVEKDSKPAFDARRLVARAMFNDLDSSYAQFKAMKIKNAKKIEAEVAKKQNLLKKLVTSYQKVIDLGSGEYTVAALYRAGELHENFSEELFKAPAPKGASQLEINQYRSAIEKVAFPLRDEAEKYFNLAHTRSKEVQTFTNWTRLARDKMTLISQEKYPPINEKNVEPVYLSHKLIWQEPVAKFVP